MKGDGVSDQESMQMGLAMKGSSLSCHKSMRSANDLASPTICVQTLPTDLLFHTRSWLNHIQRPNKTDHL